MAITRAQQVKQMLRNGGRIGLKKGTYSAEAEDDRFGGYNEPTTTTTTYTAPSSFTRGGPQDLGFESRGIGPYEEGVSQAYEIIGGEKRAVITEGPDAAKNTEERRRLREIDNLKREKVKDRFVTKPAEYNKYTPGYVKFLANLNREPNRRYFYDKVIAGGKYPGLNYGMSEDELEEAYQDYMDNRMAGKTDAMGNPVPGFSYDSEGNLVGEFAEGVSDDDFIIRDQTGIMNQAPAEKEEVLSAIAQAIQDRGAATAFLATGGRVGLRGGGMDAKDFNTTTKSTTKGADQGGHSRFDVGSGYYGEDPTPPPSGGDGGDGPPPPVEPKKTKIPPIIKKTIDLGGDISYLKNLIELNPAGIIKNIGGRLLFDKIIGDQTSLDTEEDENMLLADALTTPTADTMGLNLMDRKTLKDAGYSNSQIQELQNNPNINTQDVIRDIKGPIFAAADGGMPSYEGGIMDLESGRQMYFLGKLVKKATRAVKKIVKSPIGKAALLYAGGTYLGGLKGITGAQRSMGFFEALKSPSNLKNLFTFGKSYLGDAISNIETKDRVKLGLGAALSLSPLLFQDEDENEDEYQKFLRERGKGAQLPASIADIRNNYRQYMGTAFLADGGRPEPVAKKTMPLLDMDGKEMDFRAEGGFVPIGRMERADDVPARLSKNEIVFTADAVRNAGEGDIDKGAEVMYNMMKNLEAGGEVSEESQGMDGARKMFQTSQRLEEVL